MSSNQLMNINLIKRVFAPLLLLLIPLIGTMVSDQVNWSLIDFMLIGSLLILSGLSVHLFSERVKNKRVRIVAILITVLIFLLIWVELAVGIFGTPFAGS